MTTIESIRQYSGAVYGAILGLAVIVFIVFSYLTYVLFNATAETNFTLLAYIMMAPVIVSVILILLVLLAGKDRTVNELSNLFGGEVQ